MEPIKKRLAGVKSWLEQEFAGIRSGQASPQLLDAIKVESYGAKVPLQQVGSINVEDARTLRVSVWDAGGIAAVEEAVREADLGVSVSTDSSGLRVIFPELTTERRAQLLKLAKSKLEEARISVRAIRDEAMKDIDKEQKSGSISEDEKFTQRDAIQKEVDDINQTLESLFAKKEEELQK